jgi:hypothetical protein
MPSRAFESLKPRFSQGFYGFSPPLATARQLPVFDAVSSRTLRLPGKIFLRHQLPVFDASVFFKF